MAYASVAKGTKSGGFNSRAVIPSEFSFQPENNWTYEIGLKNTLLDRRVRLNVAAFYIDWTNLQILVPSATGNIGSITQNYGGVKAYGGEAELAAQITRGVTFNTGVAYTNPKFKKGTYDLSALNVRYCLQIASCAPNVVSGIVPPTGGAAQQAIDLNGMVRQQVSRWQVTASMNIDRPLTGDWNWFVNANYKFESAQYTNIDDYRNIGTRNTVGAQFGVKRKDLKLTFWGQNLLNDLTAYANVAGQSISRYNGGAAVPRSFYPDKTRVGISLDYSF
jgi:iron complex outermembrane receptor protein